MPDSRWRHMAATAAPVASLVVCISGCAVHVQRAQVRIEDDLATTFKISAALAQASPELRQGKNADLFGGPITTPGGESDAEARIRERAEACGATYKSYRKPRAPGLLSGLFDDDIQMEIERRYSTAHELDDGLRCADLGQPPAGYRLEKSEGLLKKTLTIAFDLPVSHVLGKDKGRFPDEIVLIMPWKIVRVEDRTESSFGKLEHTVVGDDQVRIRFVEDEAAVDALLEKCLAQPAACDEESDGSSLVKVTVVAERLKFELQTVLTMAGIALSIVTLLFGSGIARKLLENRRASRDSRGD